MQYVKLDNTGLKQGIRIGKGGALASAVRLMLRNWDASPAPKQKRDRALRPRWNW